MEIEAVDKTEKETLDTKLKYQYLIDKHNLSSPCPNECKPMNRFVYRFVNSSTITDKDFIPTQIEDESKNIVRKSNKDSHKCQKCAVSLFDTPENAFKKLKFLSEKQSVHFVNKLIAIGSITEINGLASNPNETGHLSFYEYINSNIYLTFEVFKQI